MFSLQNPLRLVVDIENADLSNKLPTLNADNPHIAVIRTGHPRENVLRFVFELKMPLKTSDFILSPNELYGHRLVVDLQTESGQMLAAEVDRLREQPQSRIAEQKEQSSAAVVAIKRAENDQTNGQPSIAPPPAASLIAAKTQKTFKPSVRPIIIAIDAGHGGEDSGAIGYRGSKEKHLTLELANKLKKIIDADPGMKSVMVRQGDYYVDLRKRQRMARAVKADLFISIHADAFTKRSASGFSVFALSQKGATSAMARALAEKENASDLIGGVSLADKDAVLAKVLVDLSMTNTISESVNIGARVLKELAKLGKLHSDRVEQAGFAVLKSADIPSLLIETGYITNPNEERKLKSGRYQQKVATAIYAAIRNYYKAAFKRSNISYAANQAVTPALADYQSLVRPESPVYHRVVAGDSLLQIAARYRTSVREIKRLNNLRGDTVILGHRLKVSDAAVAINGTASHGATAKTAVHTVRRGDSLSKISLRYNVTLKSLKKLNKLNRNTVYPGQKLKIPH